LTIRKILNLVLILSVLPPSHRLSSQLIELVYNLRRDNHREAIEPIDGNIEIRLVLYSNGNTSKVIALIIKLHKRLVEKHDVHIIWRDEKDRTGYPLDAGAYTISERISDSELDKYFTDLSAPGMTNEEESSEV
jgi:hypothetical protein